ncbi:FAD-binding oxidoreductase [Pseudomonas tremae]|uniref:FAD-binding oxidoreductase n=1 Tax=Pseudomonas syringae group TaxID=136849 RepID=UPI000EFE7ED3|nr:MULTISPECIES: FAD-binding oxidoreductase [Pseudomonas syringae group]MCF5715546.1 FAD-binding protein [Pseudomonas tremae]MCF5745317.1 FAD-binding protein [Pseudomonas tremae]MCQ2990379.1 FAD-binding oxidoreductase [Pseudomonas tremae]RMS09650.1 FAD linked oxidase [Pseudomonas coronafaciens pv. coronafaciens]UQB33777.1 FAD-binding oxidoreductase [Pseudomonas tremae]
MNAPLYSWGRYPLIPQQGHACEAIERLPTHIADIIGRHRSSLPFGNGRSYGDSCLAASDHVLDMRRLDRFIAADWQTGMVRLEAGMTLSQLLDAAIPHGWFLPVTPGTRFVTLGGAVANDVHGKNHHRRGTFGCHVKRFGLIRQGEPPMICSAQEHPRLFAATIGGLGLTGVINWIDLQLMPVRTSQIDSCVVRFANLKEFFALSQTLDARHEYSVAWIDCLAKGNNSGRGVYIVGDHAGYGSLLATPRRALSMPFMPPFSLVNNFSLRAFNSMYWHAHPRRSTPRRCSHESFFYPLDRLHHWNRLYGRNGFQQYQCVIPENCAPQAIQALLDVIAASARGSFLAVLKRCGDIVSPGLLSFPMQGTSLALDFPQTHDLAGSLFPRLDAIVREAGGRLYPAKDAHMNGSDFRLAYPAWEQLEALRDPSLMSRFWKRVMP